MVAHFLKVDGVNSAFNALLAPKTPCWLLEQHQEQVNTNVQKAAYIRANKDK